MARRRSRGNNVGELDDMSVSSPPSKNNTGARRAWPWVLVIVVGILYAFVRYTNAGSKSLFNIATDDLKNTNDLYRLHPQDHIYREPGTFTHSWRVARSRKRPDGVLKDVYTINGDFPGPSVEVVPGERLIIDVENALEDEGMSIHFHGLHMKHQNAMDGAVGITQAPIAPGESFIYNFTISDDQHGTFFYHAHDQLQRAEGLFGGLIVHSPEDSNGIDDEHILLVSDWYHRPARDAQHFYMHPGSFGNEPVPDSIIVNGQGAYVCADTVPARPVDCRQRSAADLSPLRLNTSKRSVLRVVTVGSYAGVGLASTALRFRPLRVDGGQAVSGQCAKSVGYLQPGERVDVEIERATIGTTKKDAPEVSLDTSAFKYENSALTAEHQFPLVWDGSDTRSKHTSSGTLERFDIDQLIPLQDQSSDLPQRSDQSLVLYTITQKLAHLSNEPHGAINRTSWRPQSPPLISQGRSLWDNHQFVPRLPYSSENPLWIDIVLNNLDEEGHPFHLHGYDFYVLQRYSSTYNWGSYNPFENEEAPGGKYDLRTALRKDTVLVPRRGYAHLRVKLDNPGIWMFHCHNLWHQASGMAMAFEVS